MAKKKKASASGGEVAAGDISPESHNANLKTLNSRLVKNTMEQREQINQLRRDQASLAADREILDAAERDFFKLIFSGAAGKMLKKAELAIAVLHSAEMRLVVVANEKNGIERDLERVVDERDSSRRDLDAERKRCEMLEEELRSVMREKDIVQRCREDDKRLIEKLGREMEVMIRQKDVDMVILKIENDHKEISLKVEALEEECRFLKEVRGQLEDEVGKLKAYSEELAEKVELIAYYAEFKKSFLIEFGRLKKENLELEKNIDMKEKEMTLQINELKGTITEMEAKRDLADQRRAEYDIQISNLQEKISDLEFARKSLEDAHRSCIVKITSKETQCAAMQREKNLKADAAVALTRQLNEAMKAKHMVEITLEELQKKLNYLNAENEEKSKQIDFLMVEKASLEEHREISIRGLDDMEKKLRTFYDSYSQIFARLNKTITEVVGEESAQHNLISRESGAKVDKDEEMKLFVDNLEAITLVVKGKETKIKELNQKVELLQLSVAYEKNKKGIWKWLFPATTTIFVAASLAYAARARPAKFLIS